MEPQFEAKGKNGRLLIFDNKVTLIRKGFNALMSVGLGEKDIYFKSITGINIKKNTLLTSGYIQLIMMGSNERRGRTIDLVKDENTILFSKKQEADFLKAKDLIETKM